MPFSRPFSFCWWRRLHDTSSKYWEGQYEPNGGAALVSELLKAELHFHGKEWLLVPSPSLYTYRRTPICLVNRTHHALQRNRGLEYFTLGTFDIQIHQHIEKTVISSLYTWLQANHYCYWIHTVCGAFAVRDFRSGININTADESLKYRGGDFDAPSRSKIVKGALLLAKPPTTAVRNFPSRRDLGWRGGLALPAQSHLSITRLEDSEHILVLHQIGGNTDELNRMENHHDVQTTVC